MVERVKIDGRTGRSERSRTAVAEALLALVEEGDLRPTAPRIAARAGVSLRLVFHHFKDLEALFAEAARREIERVLPTLQPVSADGPLERRIEAFAAERARLLERVRTIWRAALLQEPFSAEVSRRLGIVRAYLRAEHERVFAEELKRKKPADRRELSALLSLATGMPAWEELRRVEELPETRARQAMARALRELLA